MVQRTLCTCSTILVKSSAMVQEYFLIADQALTPCLSTGDPQVFDQLTTPKEREKDPKNTGIVGMMYRSHIFMNSKTYTLLLIAKLTCKLNDILHFKQIFC